MTFFQALEEEVVKAEMAGRSIILSMDANSKLGTEHIPGDPNKKSENGKVLEGVLQRHALCVANGSQGKVTGVVTRERTTKERTEKVQLIWFMYQRTWWKKYSSRKLMKRKNMPLKAL